MTVGIGKKNPNNINNINTAPDKVSIPKIYHINAN